MSKVFRELYTYKDQLTIHYPSDRVLDMAFGFDLAFRTTLPWCLNCRADPPSLYDLLVEVFITSYRSNLEQDPTAHLCIVSQSSSVLVLGKIYFSCFDHLYYNMNSLDGYHRGP